MNAFNYEKVTEDLRTVDDLHYFSSEIDMLSTSLFKTDSNGFKETLETKLQRNLGNLIADSLRTQNIAYTDTEILQRYFSGLKEYITHLPTMQLTIAYHPTNEQIEKLSEWIRVHTGKPVIIHLHYDPRTLGGAIITYGGKYADLTLKRRMDSVYEAKKPEILAMLKSNNAVPIQKTQQISDSEISEHQKNQSL
jgi:F0F1-type ATP synthase delta subunit